jgi:hypothetical protein
MSLFILGLMLGCFLSFFIITILVNSKKADESANRFMEDWEVEPQNCLPVIPQSTT